MVVTSTRKEVCMSGFSNSIYCGFQYYIIEFIKKDFSNYDECFEEYLDLKEKLMEYKDDMTSDAYKYFKRQLVGAKRGFRAIFKPKNYTSCKYKLF